MGEYSPVFLILIFREGQSRSMKTSREREKKMIYSKNLFCIYYELQYQEIQDLLENCWECWVWESCTVSKKASKGHIFKRKNCRQRALWTINMKTGADIITAKGTKVKRSPFSSAGLLYLWIPSSQGLPLPPSNFRGVRQETQCQQKTFHRALVS